MTKISRANNCCARSIFNSAEVWGIIVTLCVQVLRSKNRKLLSLLNVFFLTLVLLGYGLLTQFVGYFSIAIIYIEKLNTSYFKINI